MPIPSNGQNFVKPSSGGGGGVGGWIGKLFGGASDDKRARQMAQIQYDLHEAKAGVDTREIGTRTTHKVATESAGELYVDKGKHRNNLNAVKSNDRWSAKFARDNEDLGSNPMYVGNASISSKGGVRQKSATVRYPDSPNSRQATKPKGKGKPTAAADTPAADPRPGGKKTPATKSKALDSTPSSTPVSTSTNGKAEPELFPGWGPRFDGEGNNTLSPAGKAAAAKRARTPKTTGSTSTTGSSMVAESSGSPTQTTSKVTPPKIKKAGK